MKSWISLVLDLLCILLLVLGFVRFLQFYCELALELGVLNLRSSKASSEFLAVVQPQHALRTVRSMRPVVGGLVLFSTFRSISAKFNAFISIFSPAGPSAARPVPR